MLKVPFPIVGSRMMVAELAKKDKVFDLSNVEFVSAAAADEMIKRGIKVVNAKEDVVRMIEFVKKRSERK